MPNLKSSVPAAEGLAVAVAALAGGLAAGLSLGSAGAAVPHLLSPLEVPVALLVCAGAFLVSRRLFGSSPVPKSSHKWKGSGNVRDDFLAVFDDLSSELVAEMDEYNPKLPEGVAVHVRRLIEYNVPKGKLNRGITVVEAMQAIRGESPPEITWRAAALGWCVEWLQVCWYKVPEIGMNAINDGILLEMHIYSVLRRHFRSDPLYVPLMELFHEVTLQTATGQFLDLTTAEPDKVDFSRFSMHTYVNIVVYKTAFYTFYLPIACAMLLAGITDQALFQKAREICVLMGTYFQVQDDYLDCYGDASIIGKVGTDIRDNKCSWLINTCLAVATPAQIKELEANYAKNDARCEAKVKAVFEACGVKEAFHKYEEETAARLRSLISQVDGMPPTIFSQLLNRIYRRKK